MHTEAYLYASIIPNRLRVLHLQLYYEVYLYLVVSKVHG